MLCVWKERGETLAVLLDRVRKEHKMSLDTKLTYAGRLDPMAEGLVIVLAGDARFRKDSLLGLQKTYRVEVLLGVGSDTHDALGFVTDVFAAEPTHEAIDEVVRKAHMISELPYPMYSSVPVEGIPLFAHARSGTNVAIPNKKCTIYSIELLGTHIVRLGDIISVIIEDVGRVSGDFRQKEISTHWSEVQTLHADTQVTVATIEATVSSGTYMRSLATWIGEALGVPALAYRIVRTKIGDFASPSEISYKV